MNKVFIILCALAAVASALNNEIEDDFSQLKLATTDSAETSGLQGWQQVYAPFCIESRDHIFNDIERTTNDAASKAFAMLFNLAETLGKAALGTIKLGNEKLTPAIANPNMMQVSEHQLSLPAQQIFNGVSAVRHAGSTPQTFVEAFKSVVSATSTAVANAYNDKISQLKEAASTLGSFSTLEAFCDRVAQYEGEIEEKFFENKEKIAAENPEMAGDDLTMNKIPCTTSTRVIRLNSICQFAKTSAPSVSRLWATRGQQPVAQQN